MQSRGFLPPLFSTPVKITSVPLEHIILVGTMDMKKVNKTASVHSGATRVTNDSMTMSGRERKAQRGDDAQLTVQRTPEKCAQ